jgi:hypothetical protein
MIAVRIGPDWRLIAVGSPDYLAINRLLKRRRILSVIIASTTGSLTWVDYTVGSSRRMAGSYGFVLRAS